MSLTLVARTRDLGRGWRDLGEVAAFDAWWRGYQPILRRWEALVTVVDEWEIDG